ncbi:MAG: hypothetical protein IKB70_06415 [Bacilli bacterium]|nr:hypothetical protein [Bacilli bacterium]
MTDKEKFLKLLYNAIILKHYVVLYDDTPGVLYKDYNTGIVYIGKDKLRLSKLSDLNTENLREFYWNEDYVGCRDKYNVYHEFRFVKYTKIDDILA